MKITAQRREKNLEIIGAFKQNTATPEALKAYSGWGGLKTEIYDPAVYKELTKVLAPEEVSSLKQTLGNAYYTPPSIVKFMYEWLQAYGFKGGSILEPAAGIGAFLEHMPPSIKAKSKITAVELDALTSRMAQTLYPDAEHHNMGFEAFQPETKFDLIIGNPPYGAGRVFDARHADLKDARIHHYFVAKSMRLLNPNGVLAMVLPSYVLDNVNDHVRHIVHREGGDLLAAYRLPDDLFADAKVTVDIVFLTKQTTLHKWLYTKATNALKRAPASASPV